MRIQVTIVSCLLLAAEALCGRCYATPRPQDAASDRQESAANTTAGDTEPEPSTEVLRRNKQQPETNSFSESTIGLPLLKNLAHDQASIWASPFHLRWSDGSWLFPLAAASAGFLATDRAVPPALSTNPILLNRSRDVSNYGLYSLIGAGGGLYVWGALSQDDHRREAGILAGEAAIEGLAVSTALQYATRRARPYEEQGLGNFFQRGSSFPSDHSAISWAIASVIAHEYPGPLTKIAAYGVAAAVSATRVTARQHFPSDVVVGGAIGWLIGRQIYRAHHDPNLEGASLNRLSGRDDDEHRDTRHSGSPYVPLDSWVYPAFERLAALRGINTQIMGVKPWTRIECARLAEEAEENVPQGQVSNDEEAARLQAQLAQEFTYEINLLGGAGNLRASLESVYARAVSISGTALTDGFHFGQTVSYDFGRPFERGTNGQAGGSISAAAGPLVLYAQAEYQHAASAPALSSAVTSAMLAADRVSSSIVPSGPFASINRFQLMDAYVGINVDNWQLTLGPQSLSWTPAPVGSMILSNNIRPINMVRLANPEPTVLPSFLRFFGPVRIDQFFGRLQDHPSTPRPFEYGQKISMKPLPFLELGFARTVTIGGRGSGDALTSRSLFQSFFGLTNNRLASVPGDSHSEMDWTFYVPGVRNYIVLYGDAYADDDALPIKNPPKNPWHPGIFLTRFPGVPRLDLHADFVSTEQPGLTYDAGWHPGDLINNGLLNYWNTDYRDGYTNGGNLIGNTVGREGRAFESWLTYWLSPSNSVQFFYKESSVSDQFIPGGGSWQDYSVRAETHLGSGFTVKGEVQFENISRYPILFAGSRKNITGILEIGFSPRQRRGQTN